MKELQKKLHELYFAKKNTQSYLTNHKLGKHKLDVLTYNQFIEKLKRIKSEISELKKQLPKRTFVNPLSYSLVTFSTNKEMTNPEAKNFFGDESFNFHQELSERIRKFSIDFNMNVQKVNVENMTKTYSTKFSSKFKSYNLKYNKEMHCVEFVSKHGVYLFTWKVNHIIKKYLSEIK